jgi:hypothetical protein
VIKCKAVHSFSEEFDFVRFICCVFMREIMKYRERLCVRALFHCIGASEDLEGETLFLL